MFILSNKHVYSVHPMQDKYWAMSRFGNTIHIQSYANMLNLQQAIIKLWLSILIIRVYLNLLVLSDYPCNSSIQCTILLYSFTWNVHFMEIFLINCIRLLVSCYKCYLNVNFLQLLILIQNSLPFFVVT